MGLELGLFLNKINNYFYIIFYDFRESKLKSQPSTRKQDKRRQLFNSGVEKSRDSESARGVRKIDIHIGAPESDGL